MPIYEYRCEKCGKEFEAWQRISDDPIENCSECGGTARKLISQSTFVLKGSGWYVTDYGNRSSAAAAGKTSSPSSNPPSKSTCADTTNSSTTSSASTTASTKS
ncbi:MAG: zinc ribbon domain-containing protein [Syntrophaceae bacterium]|nr:zinc ribbon domain-containing protein [Syntrophaceae bacterium]